MAKMVDRQVKQRNKTLHGTVFNCFVKKDGVETDHVLFVTAKIVCSPLILRLDFPSKSHDVPYSSCTDQLIL